MEVQLYQKVLNSRVKINFRRYLLSAERSSMLTSDVRIRNFRQRLSCQYTEMRTNYIPNIHFRYHANSEYVLYMEVDNKGVDSVGNKFTHSLT